MKKITLFLAGIIIFSGVILFSHGVLAACIDYLDQPSCEGATGCLWYPGGDVGDILGSAPFCFDSTPSDSGGTPPVDIPTPPVTLYEHKDFGGDALDITGYFNLEDFSFNDKASSITIPPNYYVVVYQDKSFMGEYTVLTSDVTNLSSIGWNDKISSIEIFSEPLSNVVFYSDKDFGGNALTSILFKEVKEINLSEFNDKISSILIPSGHGPITIYADADFKGDSEVISSSVFDLKSISFNDKISSIRLSADDTASDGGTPPVDIPPGGSACASDNCAACSDQPSCEGATGCLWYPGGDIDEILGPDVFCYDSTPPPPPPPPTSPIGGSSIKLENPLAYADFPALVSAITNFIFRLCLVVAPIMLVISGLLFVTSAGDPGRVKTAQAVARNTLIGFAIILVASGLIKVLQSLLGG